MVFVASKYLPNKTLPSCALGTGFGTATFVPAVCNILRRSEVNSFILYFEQKQLVVARLLKNYIEYTTIKLH